MVSNNNVYLFLPNVLSFLINFFFPWSGGWILLTLIWIPQIEMILVTVQDMAQLRCSNPDNCWSKRFVITQYRNEVS